MEKENKQYLSGCSCTRCGNDLDKGEAESPYEDEDGSAICDDCYDEATYICAMCKDREYIKNMGRIGGLFVATDEDELGIPNGVYEVIEHPFYADGMIEMYLFSHAVRILLSDTLGIDSGRYPMAFLCDGCSKNIRTGIDQSA